MLKKTVMMHECLRCGHVWPPRDTKKKPKNCSKCKSPYWDKPVVRRSVSEARKGVKD